MYSVSSSPETFAYQNLMVKSMNIEEKSSCSISNRNTMHIFMAAAEAFGQEVNELILIDRLSVVADVIFVRKI